MTALIPSIIPFRTCLALGQTSTAETPNCLFRAIASCLSRQIYRQTATVLGVGGNWATSSRHGSMLPWCFSMRRRAARGSIIGVKVPTTSCQTTIFLILNLATTSKFRTYISTDRSKTTPLSWARGQYFGTKASQTQSFPMRAVAPSTEPFIKTNSKR